MRGKVLVVITVLAFHVFAWTLAAQEAEESANKLFTVHEDVVKPSMVAEYEKATKAFQEALAKHDMPGLQNVVVQNDQMVYSYLTEIENMATLDERPFRDLKEKMGDEAFDAMFDAYKGTYVSHRNYMIRLRADLSYMPEGAADGGGGEMNFRHFDFAHFNPGKSDEAREIAKEWVTLYESKKSPMGFRTYTGDLGTNISTYTWVRWAKSAADFYTQEEKNRELLGEEGENLWNRTLAVMDKFEHNNGRVRLDLSYIPKEEEMTAK